MSKSYCKLYLSSSIIGATIRFSMSMVVFTTRFWTFHIVAVWYCVVIEDPNMASEKKSTKASSKDTKSNEQILSEFQTLRNEQRMMANKLSEMEMELNEHKYESTNLYAYFCLKKQIILNRKRNFFMTKLKNYTSNISLLFVIFT